MEILDTEDEDWDCMRVMVTVDPTGAINKDPTQWVGVEDWRYTGTHANFRWNKLEQDQLPDGQVNPTSDYRIDLTESSTNCAANGSDGMDCAKGDEMNHGIITHFTRDWKTGDAPTSDAEISHETGGIQRKFFAFVN